MQINLVIATMIATTIDGAVAYLYYADRLYQLPLGVIGVAIGVVLLPDLSRKLRAGNEAGALNSQNRALELSLFLTLAGGHGPDGHTRTDHPYCVRAWRLHPGRHHGRGACRAGLRRGPSGLCPDQGLPAGLLCPRGHQDTDALRHRLGGREHRGEPCPVALVFGHVGIAMATSIAAWVNAVLSWHSP